MSEQHVRVAIVGTGFSGIGMAVRLMKEGFNDFLLFERSEALGGTWRENSYPGCACDVPSNLYSFSFALNPNWSQSYSPQAEIWQYLQDTSVKFGVEPFIRYGHDVTNAAWNDERKLWELETSQGAFTANVVVGGIGPLAEPVIPSLPGIENFQGETFHSATWNHDYDLRGKRVAVVGTGASAIQFVPEIQQQVEKLHLFQRTAPWIMPRFHRRLSKFEHRLFKIFPPAQRLVRGAIYAAFESRVIGFVYQPKLMKVVEWYARHHYKKQVPDRELRKKLIPKYTIGCKRVLMSNNYLPSLSEPNVEVVTDGIQEIRANSVVSNDGVEREVDAIIWGTGFHVTDSPAMERLAGSSGQSIAEVWNGSPRTYLGTAVDGFPNLFLLAGPNTGIGHTSLVYMIESTANYVVECLKYMRRNDVASVEVKPEAQDRFDAAVQKRMKGSVWTAGGCASWYIDATGRNTTLWPDFTFKYRRLTARFDPAAYDIVLNDRKFKDPVSWRTETATKQEQAVLT